MKDCSEQVSGFERAAVRMSKDDRADIFGKAKINRNRLKSGLERNGSPKAIGSRTQGSYAMKTMIQHDRGDYDVDDGVYFKRDSLKNDQGEDQSLEDARKMVSDALQDKRFADQPEPRNNCVRVYYKQKGYHVDMPVYRENRTTDPITNAEKKWFEIAAGDNWRTSDPLANTKWFKDANATKSPDASADGNDGQFVRIVRLVKGFARSRYGWSDKITSGFTISKLVCDNFVRDDGRDDRSFRETMKGISLAESGWRRAASGAEREPRRVRRPEDRFLQGKDRREPEAPRRARQARLHARRSDEGLGCPVLYRLVLEATRPLEEVEGREGQRTRRHQAGRNPLREGEPPRVSLPLEAALPAASEEPGLDDWFVALDDEYVGRAPAGSLRAGMVDGWRLHWRGRELDVQVDADFPFSAARIYVAGYARAQAQPHIERDGKLCLGAKPVPGDRVRTVQAALAEAFKLLTENETRQHDDFREDFGLYWLNWANRSDLRVEVMPGTEGANESMLGRAALMEGRVFVFPDKGYAGRFCANLTGVASKWLKETPVISIDPLPAPDRYPETADELWALVEARSQGGTDLLARLMANASKEAFVVLAGKAPSGREHYAAVYLRRPLDREGRPLNRRALRKGMEKPKESASSLFGRFRLQRLATQRMDSSSSRLPEGVQGQISAAKVIVVGCGALGSGIARMLAKAGVENLHLVDPENLGWENIRRHDLGGSAVGHGTAKALAHSIRADLPMIGFVEGYVTTFATFARAFDEGGRTAYSSACARNYGAGVFRYHR